MFLRPWRTYRGKTGVNVRPWRPYRGKIDVFEASNNDSSVLICICIGVVKCYTCHSHCCQVLHIVFVVLMLLLSNVTSGVCGVVVKCYTKCFCCY